MDFALSSDAAGPDEASLDAATSWLVRLRGPDAGSLRAAFSRWLTADPQHAAAFDQVSALWAATDVTRRMPVPGVLEARQPRRGWQPLGWAAGAVATVVLAAALLVQWPQTYEAGIGEQRAVVLEDGSRVELNTRSQLRVDLDGDSRQARLDQGEAFFHVRRDPARPFSVRTPHGVVQVLGTSFNVRVADATTLVSVASGEVAVRSPDGASRLDLVADQSATLGSSGVQPASVAVAQLTAWRQQQLVYDNVTLAELVDDLGRYLPETMSIADDDLAAMKVSAVLEIRNQSSMLDALAASLPLRWQRVSDNLIVISAQG